MESDSSEEYKFAYQKFGLQSFSDKVDKVESAFNEKLNDVVHIMVQDALCLEDATVTRESFVLRVRDTVPIGELRDTIQSRYEELGYWNAAELPSLKLVYGGRELVNGKRFCDYAKEKQWPKPYAGIVWIVSFQVDAMKKYNWGNAKDRCTT